MKMPAAAAGSAVCWDDRAPGRCGPVLLCAGGGGGPWAALWVFAAPAAQACAFRRRCFSSGGVSGMDLVGLRGLSGRSPPGGDPGHGTGRPRLGNHSRTASAAGFPAFLGHNWENVGFLPLAQRLLLVESLLL